jgi:hypothetical protein
MNTLEIPKKLGEDLAELRWKNGWRAYFSRTGYKKIVLIVGGHIK